MENHEARPVPVAHDAYGALMLQAARVLRVRYVECGRVGLSPSEANNLVHLFEGLAVEHPAYDRIDPDEAIGLAHRLLDDDHPELSRLWPGAR